MGKQQQRKGANGERELTLILQGNGFDVQRGGSMTYGTIPDIVGLPGVHIEVKRQERLNLLSAVKQAETDAVKFADGIPAVFHRKNRSKWLVTMSLECWLTMYEKTDFCGKTREKGGENDANNEDASCARFTSCI